MFTLSLFNCFTFKLFISFYLVIFLSGYFQLPYIITFPSLSIYFPSSIHLFLSASLYPLASSYLNNLLSIYFFYFFPSFPCSFYLCISLFPHLFIFYCNIVPEPIPTLVVCNRVPTSLDSGWLRYSSEPLGSGPEPTDSGRL